MLRQLGHFLREGAGPEANLHNLLTDSKPSFNQFLQSALDNFGIFVTTLKPSTGFKVVHRLFNPSKKLHLFIS